MGSPTIIILHGWNLSGERFLPLVNELQKKGHRVLAPDLPGFGTSSLPQAPLNLSDYAHFLHTYIQSRHVQKPVLIGHSFGGRVALKYQALYPGTVRALILSGTPGFTPVSKKKLLLFITLAKVGNFLFSIPPLSFMKNFVRQWYYYLVGAREFLRAEGAMRETFKNIVREELETCMKAVSVPCLLLWGEHDTMVPVPIAQRMHAIIRESHLVVISGGYHGVPFQEPTVFASHVQKFLNSL